MISKKGGYGKPRLISRIGTQCFQSAVL
ncbi:Protein of unknown function [Pyronema omphalodes CBS 100304]|uniref:Uncharacterized protein n=1 Tax=Pyronema omphalodes (strain CBS 100304) TaxID=1076935 RepID=U4KYB3_PYROM|nr:Protein of unknown function [Pyronema omphalodes CBS 100304]